MIHGKRILVTGATGYIGSNLVQSLKDANELYCVYRDRDAKPRDESLNWILWDMNKEMEHDKFPGDVDTIIHLAMNPAKDPEKNIEALKVNTMSTLQLLEYARRSGIQTFLYTSSGSVYGFGKEPFRENDQVSINDFYSLTKYGSELLIKQYSDNFNAVVLRYFVPYGPGQSGKLVPNLISRIKKGEQVTITNEGNPVMNPIYITDLIEVTTKALDLTGTHTINIGGTEALSILDVANTIGQVLGKEPTLKNVKDPSKIGQDLVGDITKMKELLSFTPKVSFKYGIKNVVEMGG